MKNLFPYSFKKGFTLIELMVVIAIIGILSSVVLASLTSARVKARDARRVADLKQIQIALELYRDSHNAYPDNTGSDALSKLKTDGDLSVIPTDPSSLASYYYGYKTTTSGVTAYHLGANLEQASSATTLSTGDLDIATSDIPGWTSGFNGLDNTAKQCDGATAWAGFCYDVSNVGAP